ncbi:Zinc/iron permease [Thelonectria olida]|uniref:Zinc/iron permease n=1 Tax=Thelonectria olida TaxID=1576542 RepID=A0A9P9AQS6_9HYPO|nr:Zinc/iron permease [Thelonectria olida]
MATANHPIIGAGFPVAAKKMPRLKIPPKVFFICKHFGTGVLIATAFVHLLPTAFGSLMDPCLPDLFIEYYPAMPGVIMMGSMFLLFIFELYLNAKTGGHSHGGPTGTAPISKPHSHPRHDRSPENTGGVEYEKAMAQRVHEKNAEENDFVLDDEDSSTMPAWFIVFYEQYIRQRTEMLEIIQETRNLSLPEYDEKASTEAAKAHFDEEGQMVDPQVYKKMSTNITLLEGGILFHSIFVGMTIAMTTDGLVVLLTAIIFHQMFEGLGLGSRIAAVPYPRGSPRPWLLVFAFGTTAPIGQAIGIMSRSSFDPGSEYGLIMIGVFNAISSGLLIYAALVNLLVEDFLSEEASHLMSKKDKISALVWVFVGGM